MGIYDVLRNEPGRLHMQAPTLSNGLYLLAEDFCTYVDSYQEKLHILDKILEPGADPSALRSLAMELELLHRAVLGKEPVADSTTRTPDVLPNSVATDAALSPGQSEGPEAIASEFLKIIGLLRFFLARQQACLKALFVPGTVPWDPGRLLDYVNEEASVFFCYSVKDAFESQGCTEKTLITQINERWLTFAEAVVFDDDIHALESEALSLTKISNSTLSLFENFIALIRRRMGTRCIQLLVVEPPTERIEVKLYSYLDHLPMYDVAHEGGIIWEAVTKGQMLCINSVLSRANYDMYDATIKSEFAVPLYKDNAPVAVLNFEDTHLNRFSETFTASMLRTASLLSERIGRFADIHCLKKTRVPVRGPDSGGLRDRGPARA